MSLEALRGTPAPLDPRIHAARPHRGQIAAADSHAGAALRQRDPGVPSRGRPTGAGRVQSPLRPAGARRGGRRHPLRRGDRGRRAQRLHRQPAGIRGRRGDLRRQLPRPAGGAGARSARDDPDHAAGDRRAPGGAAGQPGPVAGSPGLSDRRSRTQQRVHDGADHRRLAGGGVARHRDAGQHRLDPDRCQPGGLRAHGDGGGLEGAADPGQRASGGGRGAAVCGAGPRVPEAAGAGPAGWPSCTVGCAGSRPPSRPWRPTGRPHPTSSDWPGRWPAESSIRAPREPRRQPACRGYGRPVSFGQSKPYLPVPFSARAA